MQKLPDFIIVPYLLLEDKEITLVDERLYGIIYWFCKLKLEKCIASNKTLAELVKTTPATIQNSLTKLENKEFIIRKFKDSARKNRLEIIPLVAFGKISLTNDSKDLVSPTSDSVSPTSDRQVSLTDDQNKNIYNKKIKEEKETAKTSFLRGNQWNELIDLFENVNPLYLEFYKNKTERKALDMVAEKMGFEITKSIIGYLPKSNTIKFVPKITKPTELKRDLAKLLAWASEKKQSNKGRVMSFKK
jgi:hypothetical protein